MHLYGLLLVKFLRENYLILSLTDLITDVAIIRILITKCDRNSNLYFSYCPCLTPWLKLIPSDFSHSGRKTKTEIMAFAVSRESEEVRPHISHEKDRLTKLSQDIIYTDFCNIYSSKVIATAFLA